MNSGNRVRNILFGVAAFAVVLVVIVFLLRRGRQPSIINVSTPLPTPISNYRQELQNNFGITVPNSAISASLKDVSGGVQEGIAIYDKSNGQFVYTIIASLNEARPGYFYQGFLVRGKPGDNNFDMVSLGRLEIAKGGYIVNYTSSKDLLDHKDVWVVLGDKHILEGSF